MESPRPPAGAQTLDRGLRALEMVATARDGLTIQDLSTALGVHRSIASRLLSTLADRRLVIRGGDGRFRTGAGLAALAAGIHTTLRATAAPILHELVDKVGATISLLVAEGGEAVALEVVEPPTLSYVLSFRAGSRHPLGRGSAGVALRAARPQSAGEEEAVTTARKRGYAETFGEVEPGAYGVAVPIVVPGLPAACLNLITHRGEIAASAGPVLAEAAARIVRELS